MNFDDVYGKRHLVCDGPLNGSYVEAGFGPDLEPKMLDTEHADEYELGEWPTGERVWLHNRVPFLLYPGAGEFPDAQYEGWVNAYGTPTLTLPERIREAIMDAEVR